MTLREVFDEFLYTKEVDGLKDGSIHNYRVTIGYFLDAMRAETALKVLNLLELKRVQEYVKKCLDSNISRATAASYDS